MSARRIVEQDGLLHIAYCVEAPAANGWGNRVKNAWASLREAIAFVLEYSSERQEQDQYAINPL